ncbi:MAG: glycine--tRNA ligase subunit beta, partial [Rhizobiaceae bacterium]|nr:glycine--tRNA ligase subunit beta [Rhizobiaceae bacterium]
AIDEKPTGSKDPFALRRAALGVVRILIENGISLTHIAEDGVKRALGAFMSGTFGTVFAHLYLRDMESDLNSIERLELKGLLSKGTFKETIAHFLGEEAATEVAAQTNAKARFIALDLLSFFHDRLKVYLRDNGARHDLIDAVISEDSDDLLQIVRRVEALEKLLETEDGKNLLAGTKRAANILAAEEKKGTRIADSVEAAFLNDSAEKTLFEALNQAENKAAQAIQNEDFSTAMVALGALREPIDSFFEKVLVNDQDEAVRANRLALLARVRAATNQVADFSKIAG